MKYTFNLCQISTFENSKKELCKLNFVNKVQAYLKVLQLILINLAR